jgi:hypothetical protein
LIGQNELNRESKPNKADFISDIPGYAATASADFPLSLLDTFTAPTPSERLSTLRCYLPSEEDARYLKTLGFKYCTWYSSPITENDFDVSVLATVYHGSGMNGNGNGVEDALHQIALLFIILALGSLMHPKLAPLNIQADRYWQLAHAALCGSRAVEQPTYEALCAVVSSNLDSVEAHLSHTR